MILCIGGMLDEPALDSVRARLDALPFREGRETAGHAARRRR